MPLDPNVAALLGFLKSAGIKELHEGTVDDARAGMRKLMVELRDPATLPQVKSVDPVEVGGRPARVYRPDATGPVPTLLYLHGGGFVIGDLDTHEGVCRSLCRDVGAVVVSLDYRLAPEHRFPAAVDDAWTGLQWVTEHVSDLGGRPDRIAIGGDSAGGNLSAVTAQRAAAEGVPLAAQLLVYPAVDVFGEYASRQQNANGYFLTLADMAWFAAHYLDLGPLSADAEATDPGRLIALRGDVRASPLLAPRLTGLAPAVVATAEFDPLRDEGNRYAEALEAAGVPVRHREFPGLIHGFYGLELLGRAIADASTWINTQLAELLA